MSLDDIFVCIASILSPHGIKGSFKVRSYTSKPEDIVSYGEIYDEKKVVINISIISISTNFLICKSNVINNRIDAQKLNGQKLYIKRHKLPKLGKNEYYNFDLIGLKVYKKNRDYVGYIINILNFGAGDILEVKTKEKDSILLPFGPKHPSKVNIKNKEIEIDISEDWYN